MKRDERKIDTFFRKIRKHLGNPNSYIIITYYGGDCDIKHYFAQYLGEFVRSGNRDTWTTIYFQPEKRLIKIFDKDGAHVGLSFRTVKIKEEE